VTLEMELYEATSPVSPGENSPSFSKCADGDCITAKCNKQR